MDNIEEIKKKFNVIKQLGRAGERTVAYLCNDKENSFVVKIPNRRNPNYCEEQKNAIQKQKRLTRGYQGKIKFPNEIVKDGYVMSQYLGVDFSKEIYDSLCSKEKSELEKQFADFLVFTHSKEKYSISEYKEKCTLDESNKINCNDNSEKFKEIILDMYIKKNVFIFPDLTELLQNSLNENIQELEQNEIAFLKNGLKKSMTIISLSECINRCEKNVNNNDVLEEIKECKKRNCKINEEEKILRLTHADLRSQNVLYDEQNKSLAIIDFESSKIANIYSDFVSNVPASFGMSYEFLFNVINYYNEKSDYKISKEKICDLHNLGCFYEYARNSDLTKKENCITVLQQVETKNKEMKKALIKSTKVISR